MHPEELCRIIQTNENNNADEMEYEHEMTSHEYLMSCEGSKQFSVRKFLRLVQEERKQRLENRMR